MELNRGGRFLSSRWSNWWCAAGAHVCLFVIVVVFVFGQSLPQCIWRTKEPQSSPTPTQYPTDCKRYGLIVHYQNRWWVFLLCDVLTLPSASLVSRFSLLVSRGSFNWTLQNVSKFRNTAVQILTPFWIQSFNFASYFQTFLFKYSLSPLCSSPVAYTLLYKDCQALKRLSEQSAFLLPWDLNEGVPPDCCFLFFFSVICWCDSNVTWVLWLHAYLWSPICSQS